MATKTSPPPPPPPSTRSKQSGKRSQTWIWLGLIAVAILAAGSALMFSGGDSSSSNDGADGGSGGSISETRPVTLSGAPLPELPDTGTDPAVGTAAPTLSGKSFDGTPVAVDPSKGPVMLVFLAHWCPHCNREIPELIAYGSQSGLPEGLQIIGVTTAVAPERDNYPPSEWIESRGWEYPVIADDASNTAALTFGLSGFPYTVLIDTDGTVADRWSGELGQEAIADRVSAAFG